MLINFLVACHAAGLAFNSIRSYKSSISTHWSTLHPESSPASENILVKAVLDKIEKLDMLKRATTSTIRRPWEMTRLFDLLRGYGANESMSFKLLSYKTYTLLALTTAWRPGSDIGRIVTISIRFFDADGGHWAVGDLGSRLPVAVEFTALGVKEAPRKTIRVGAWTADDGICPVRTLLTYLRRTEKYRGELPATATLFLSLNGQRQPVRYTTCSQWMRSVLQQADLEGMPHDSRGQSSSLAFRNGAELAKILESANWASQATFFRHYCILEPAADTVIGEAVLAAAGN